MTYDLTLGILLLFSTLGAAGVLGLSMAAFLQRRSWPYLLVALALGVLSARAGTGLGYMAGYLSVETHHLLEHGLDVLMAALVIAAVVSAHTLRKPVGGETG